jgi:hypothetical protein
MTKRADVRTAGTCAALTRQIGAPDAKSMKEPAVVGHRESVQVETSRHVRRLGFLSHRAFARALASVEVLLGRERGQAGVASAGVEPLDPFERGDLDIIDGARGSVPGISSVLNEPVVDSAMALSGASPTEPTEGSTPASISRLVKAMEVYCGPGSL